MKRGELYRVLNPTAKDPKKSRVFVVVSRQILLDSRLSTVICAPIYTTHHGLSTQVAVGIEAGLKHEKQYPLRRVGQPAKVGVDELRRHASL